MTINVQEFKDWASKKKTLSEDNNLSVAQLQENKAINRAVELVSEYDIFANPPTDDNIPF